MRIADMPWTEGNVVAFGATLVAWIALGVVLLLSRRKGEGGGKSNPLSMIGIALQGIGIAAAWFGPITFSLAVSEQIFVAAAPAAVIAFLSVALMGWAIAIMGANWAVVAQVRNEHQLVQSGPFALMRNPIYVALCGMMIATALAVGHAVNLIVAVPLYLIGTLVRVGIEEKLLRATFGQAYDDYARRVKRFIPGIW